MTGMEGEGSNVVDGVILKVRNLRKAYGRRVVLDGLNLTVRRGEFVCVLGRNGSGKTTLLNAIAGLTSYEGLVELGVKRVGFALQRPSLYPRLTVRENMEVFASIMGVRGGAGDELVRVLGVESDLDTPVFKLSHGTAKKVELICALLNDPDLILMDEPLVSLDYDSRLAVLGLLHELKSRKKTVITVTHLPEVLSPLCDSTYLLKNGKLERYNLSKS